MDARDLIKPPFANYDVVVYIGCGIFSLPMIAYYMLPVGVALPLRPQFRTDVPFTDAAVTTLFAVFAVYLLGHLYAYLSSILIEKSADEFLGEVSTAMLISLVGKDDDEFRRRLAARVRKKWRDSWKKGHRLRSALRVIALLPVMPILYASYQLNIFGYFKTRLSIEVVGKMLDRLKLEGLPKPTVKANWYKTVEHFVINNVPDATPRMYNYLVISGLFRSLSLLFLLCSWMEFLRTLGGIFKRVVFGLSGVTILEIAFMKYVFFAALFGFCVTAYVKFSRRYSEEMIFAFALKK